MHGFVFVLFVLLTSLGQETQVARNHSPGMDDEIITTDLSFDSDPAKTDALFFWKTMHPSKRPSLLLNSGQKIEDEHSQHLVNPNLWPRNLLRLCERCAQKGNENLKMKFIRENANILSENAGALKMLLGLLLKWLFAIILFWRVCVFFFWLPRKTYGPSGIQYLEKIQNVVGPRVSLQGSSLPGTPKYENKTRRYTTSKQ